MRKLIVTLGVLVLIGLTGCFSVTKEINEEQISSEINIQEIIKNIENEENSSIKRGTTDYVYTTKAKAAIVDAFKSSNLDTAIGDQAVQQLKYSDSVKKTLETVSSYALVSNVGGYTQFNLTSESYKDYPGQCVYFAKGFTGIGATKTWKKGTQVTATSNIAAGTLIARFSSDGTYKNIVGENHVAMYFGKNTKYIIVIDQNWNAPNVKSNVLATHRIYFSGTGVAKADEYYTVQ